MTSYFAFLDWLLCDLREDYNPFTDCTVAMMNALSDNAMLKVRGDDERWKSINMTRLFGCWSQGDY
jgi:hypothetical protein